MRVLCINDAGRPNEIPASKWIKKGEEYTVIYTQKCHVQGGAISFKLAEIDLTGCEPYEGFNAERFAIDIDSIRDEIEEKRASFQG
jgi:hypothetical protein